MELKRLISKFTYKIESLPGGGFVAHCTDPSVPSIEAPTREELQKKIQATVASSLASEFPGLKLPTENDQELHLAFHIEHKPGGGFTLHSANPDSKPIELANHEEMESHLSDRLLGFAAKHLAPELLKNLDARGGSGDIKVTVNSKTGFQLNVNGKPTASHLFTKSSDAEAMQPKVIGDSTQPEQALLNSPTAFEKSNTSTLLFILLAVLALGAAMYFFLHYS